MGWLWLSLELICFFTRILRRCNFNLQAKMFFIYSTMPPVSPSICLKQPPSAIASLLLPPFPSLGATPLKNALNEPFISPASLLHLRSQPCQSIRDTIDLKRKQQRPINSALPVKEWPAVAWAGSSTHNRRKCLENGTSRESFSCYFIGVYCLFRDCRNTRIMGPDAALPAV